MSLSDTVHSLVRSSWTLAVHLWGKAAPSIAWVYLTLACYVCIGIYVYPVWWKTFLLSGGLLDGAYWADAWRYISALILSGQPLGLSLVAVVLSSVLVLVYKAGRRSGSWSSHVRRPNTAATTLVTCVLAISLFGLTRIREDFETADALEARVAGMIDKWHTDLEDDPMLDWIAPPKTGLYVYLDGSRLGQMNNALQKDLTVAAETATTELEAEKRGALEGGAISGAIAERKRLLQSIQRTPPTDSPSRQADWLVQAYGEVDIALRVAHNRIPQAWRSAHAIALLSERGVFLTYAQQRALAEGDATLLEERLRTQNLPLLFHGHFNVVVVNSDTVRFSFEAGNVETARLLATGIGKINSFDGAMRACVKQKGGCRRHGNVLGVVWASRRSGATVNIDFVPLASW